MAEPEFDEEIGGLGAVVSQQDMVEQAKTGEPVEDYGTRARRVSKMTRDKALERLQRGYDELAAQKTDKRDRWLALAQGMLAPTKTGGFGESLGMATGLLREQRGEEREFEADRATRLAEMEEAMAREEREYAEREIDILGEEQDIAKSYRGNLKDIYIADPEDPNKTIRVLGAFNQETGLIEPVPTTQGGFALRPDDLDPVTRFNLAQAAQRGKTGVQVIDKDVENLKIGKARLASMYRGLDLLEAIKDEGGTSGFTNLVQKMSEFLGSEAEAVANRGELMALMGDQLFSALDSFGTQINERELQMAKDELAASGTRSRAVNEAILQQLVQKLEAEYLNTREMVSEFGSDQQARQAMLPIPNYGLSEEMTKRATDLGIRLHKHIPFGEEDTVELTERSAGERGTLQNPHEATSNEELQYLMSPEGREKNDIRAGDILKAPDGQLYPVQ